MAKTPSKSKTRVSGPSKTRRAAKKHRTSVTSPTQYSHEDHLDGCHLNVDDSEATPDAELPAAIEGMEIAAAKGRGRLL